MAHVKYTGTPATWPPVHSRSYYRAPYHAGHVIRNYKRKHSPRDATVPNPQLYYFGMQAAQFNRAYLAQIMTWWTDGAAPNGQAWWNTLAAATPVMLWPGTTETISGWRFFLWFQKVSLVAEGLWKAPYKTDPTYLNPVFPPTPNPYPDYPRLPWSPPPPASILTAAKSAANAITIGFLDNGFNGQHSTSVLLAKAPYAVAENQTWPHLIVCGWDGTLLGPPVVSHVNAHFDPLRTWPLPGSEVAITIRTFDRSTRQPADYAPLFILGL
jgi:hypothetical protein